MLATNLLVSIFGFVIIFFLRVNPQKISSVIGLVLSCNFALSGLAVLGVTLETQIQSGVHDQAVVYWVAFCLITGVSFVSIAWQLNDKLLAFPLEKVFSLLIFLTLEVVVVATLRRPSLWLMSLSVIGPLLEEMTYRELLYVSETEERCWRKRCLIAPREVVLSCVFAVQHGVEPQKILFLMMAGTTSLLFYSIRRIYKNGLIVCIALHSAINTMFLLVNP